LRGAIASPRPEHRAAITDPTAFGGLLRAIDGFEGQPTTKAALQLMALLACRPGELRHASWVEFDLDRRVWNVPAERTKMRRPHRIPLPAQAVAILKALHPVTGHGVAGLVFPGLRSVKRRSTCCASPVLRYPSPIAIRQKPGETAQAPNVAQIHCSRCGDPWVDRPRVIDRGKDAGAAAAVSVARRSDAGPLW
jgi:integrase